MTNKKWKSILVFIFSFFIFFSIIYLGFSIYEMKTLTEWRNSQDLDMSKESEGLKKVLENTNHEYFEEGSPTKWVYFQYSILVQSLDHMTSLQNNTIKKEYDNYFLWFFETYGRRYIFITFYTISRDTWLMAYSVLQEELDPSLLEWEKEGGKREGEWWKEFEKSRQYKDFVSKIIEQAKNPKGNNIDNLIDKIKNFKYSNELSLKNIIVQKYVIPSLQEKANLAYRDLKVNISQGDFVSSLVNSHIIYTTYFNLEIMKERGLYSYDGEIHNYKTENTKKSMYSKIFLMLFLALITGSFVTIVYNRRY